MEKRNNSKAYRLTALALAFTPTFCVSQSHVYSLHNINATIEEFDDQSKQDNNHQQLEQICGSLKQQNQRQSILLDETRAQLTQLQAELQQQQELYQKLTALEQQVKQLTQETSNATKQLTLAGQQSKTQAATIAELQRALAQSHEEKESLKLAHTNLNHELLCAQQERETHSIIAKEYDQLKQQLAQAETDSNLPMLKQ